MDSSSGGNLTLEKVYQYFQSQVSDSVNDLNSALDSASSGSSGASSASSSGGASGTDSTGGTSSTSSAGGSTPGGVSADPVETGQISYLFQMVSVAMSTEASTMKSLRDSLSGMISSIN